MSDSEIVPVWLTGGVSPSAREQQETPRRRRYSRLYFSCNLPTHLQPFSPSNFHTGHTPRTHRGSLQTLHLPALDNNGCMALTVETSNNEGEGPLSPPYWQLRLRSHSSLSSTVAKQKRLSGTIRLEDHTEESSETYNSVWAKAVTIDDFTVVGAGVGPALGSYVVWNCTIETLNVSETIMHYSTCTRSAFKHALGLHSTCTRPSFGLP